VNFFQEAQVHPYAGAGSIFGPLSQTHISKKVFMDEISSSASALLDIQLTLLRVCGVDSFLPELEHL